MAPSKSASKRNAAACASAVPTDLLPELAAVAQISISGEPYPQGTAETRPGAQPNPHSIPVSEIPASELGLANWGTADLAALQHAAVGALRFLLQDLSEAGIEIPSWRRMLCASIGSARAILELHSKRQVEAAAKIDARRAGTPCPVCGARGLEQQAATTACEVPCERHNHQGAARGACGPSGHRCRRDRHR